MSEDIFAKHRQASATRIADNIKLFIDGTPKGQKVDHNGAISAAVICEITQLAATIGQLEAKLTVVQADMTSTRDAITQIVGFIQKSNTVAQG